MVPSFIVFDRGSNTATIRAPPEAARSPPRPRAEPALQGPQLHRVRPRPEPRHDPRPARGGAQPRDRRLECRGMVREVVVDADAVRGAAELHPALHALEPRERLDARL